ncbi:hypothetical protein B0H10DRAFT_2233842 [Mycena sp. CBHHK59/15]|nr:hypothetical protein B0H10DRAFT_2233842 [Mycena sp. CBHHK59/15]
MPPAYINSSTITISAEPSTIYSVYGSREIQEFINSFTEEISEQSRELDVPYRLIIVPSGQLEKRIRLFIDLPNGKETHSRFLQFILRKFRTCNELYDDFTISLANHGLFSHSAPPRPNRRQRRRAAQKRNQQRDTKRAGFPYHY